MTIADGRTGAIGMTFNRVPSSTDLPSDLLQSLKDAVFITDNSFDSKLVGLLTDAIFDFEKIAAYSIFPQEITVNYEYFKGKNRLPFAPHTAVTPITDFTVTGASTKYLDGGTGDAVTVVFTAGNATIPENIKRVLVKMAEAKFKNEVSAMDYPFSVYSQIRSFTNWID